MSSKTNVFHEFALAKVPDYQNSYMFKKDVRNRSEKYLFYMVKFKKTIDHVNFIEVPFNQDVYVRLHPGEAIPSFETTMDSYILKPDVLDTINKIAQDYSYKVKVSDIDSKYNYSKQLDVKSQDSYKKFGTITIYLDRGAISINASSVNEREVQQSDLYTLKTIIDIASQELQAKFLASYERLKTERTKSLAVSQVANQKIPIGPYGQFAVGNLISEYAGLPTRDVVGKGKTRKQKRCSRKSKKTRKH